MALTRYLMYYSYIGKPFQGAQRQVKGGIPRLDDPSTVQGRIEMGLKRLNPCNDPVVALSSRTDAGVHALTSTCHFDLYRTSGLIYEPKTISLCLNKYFVKEEIPLRVLKTYLVPNDFHCRQASWRTYLYRFANININPDDLKLAHDLSYIPIEELERCYFIRSEMFDIEKMREAAKLLEGLHDFRSFMGRGSKDPDKMTRRFVNRLDICDGKALTCSGLIDTSVLYNRIEDYQFYDIYIQANGFLFRQVRRMVAALIAVGQGKVLSSAIKLMLEVPSQHSWNDRLRTAPAHGLYLCQVEYSDADKLKFKEN